MREAEADRLVGFSSAISATVHNMCYQTHHENLISAIDLLPFRLEVLK